MKLYKAPLGSAEWYRLRLGVPTSSNFHKILTPTGAPSKQARKYLHRLVAERLLNETMEDQLGYIRWVEWGKGQEGNAIATFEFTNDVTLEPGAFVTTDDGRLGASPDRLFKGARESMEVKCPAPWTHVGYLLDGPGDDYVQQVQGHILVGEFEASHFYSWHPQCPPFHRMTLPIPKWQDALREALLAFCDALDAETERARALGAYAVVHRVETPADLAYSQPEDQQVKYVTDDPA